MLSKIALLALAVTSQAAPAPAPGLSAIGATGDKTYSVTAVHNANFQRNGTAALLKAYKKFNLKPTKEVSEAFKAALSLEKRQDSSAPASPSDGVEYLVPVTVGGQSLNLDFDTGSADLWVFSSLLASSSRSGHDYYTSSKSTTYKAISGCKWKIEYADNSGASGVCGTDTVVIGGTTVKGQVIELANKVSSEFVSDKADGLVGLAFSSINTVTPTQAETFFDNAQSSLDSPLFGAYLPFNADGEYDFGYTDSSKYTGSITYASVDSSNGFWEFPSTSYKIGSTTKSQSGWTGIADTGTTLILMGDSAVDAYYAKVSGSSYDDSQGGYTFPCSATLPTLSFRIGSSTYATIPASLLNFGVASGSTCFGSLQSVGDGTQAIYGDVFFNAYYGVFDASGPQFGFAKIAS